MISLAPVPCIVWPLFGDLSVWFTLRSGSHLKRNEFLGALVFMTDFLREVL